MTGADQLPPSAWVSALAGLPGMGPVRLGALLCAWSPEQAWSKVLDGGLVHHPEVIEACRGLNAEVVDSWASAARRTDPVVLWERHRAAGVHVLTEDHHAWPVTLADDPEPPSVLFVQGDPAALARPSVAVVGTRRATPTGRAVARDLGADLAEAGVAVLSGLALGIDGAAHAGALATAATPPVAVVGTGLDVVYPRAHADLAAQVAARGAVVSEYPLGTPPAAWRFPARNRILAALALAVVVVESPVRGGSMHTVDAALERDRCVLAVPGSVRNPLAAGTNDLLAAGCPPARDATDVLVAIGLTPSPPPTPTPGRGHGQEAAPASPDVSVDQQLVLDALGWDQSTLEQVADRLASPLGPVSLHLGELEHAGHVTRVGQWFSRLSPPVP